MPLKTTPSYKLGEIWLANLNPNRGKEPGKVRPVLILQNAALLKVDHPTTVIIPLTSTLHDDAYPLRLRVRKTRRLKEDSDLLMDQIRAIDNRRLIEGPLLQCGPRFLSKVYRALFEVLGFDLRLFNKDPSLSEAFHVG